MANPSGLKPATIEAMFNAMTGNDPNQKWKLDEATGDLVPDDQFPFITIGGEIVPNENGDLVCNLFKRAAEQGE